MGELVDVPSLDGSTTFRGYSSEPAGPADAAIIVVQEIFGLNEGICRKTDDWAAKGYLALAPEMFWRFAPGYDADPDDPEQLKHAMAQRDQLDLDLAVADIEASLRYVRSRLPGKKVGVVGYCWGGSVAYLAATRTDAAACVGYYGRQIVDHLHEQHAIAHPLMLHFGEADPSIPSDMRTQVRSILGSNPRVTIHDYAGAGHGFASSAGTRRQEEPARLADGRTEAFFAQHLASAN